VIVLFILIIGYSFYHKVYGPNVEYSGENKYLYIPTGTDYEQLVALLANRKIIRNIEAFQWVAVQMNFPGNVHPGKYRLIPRMSNYELIKLLRSGKQEPVNLVINKFRLKEDMAGFVSEKLEADSATLVMALNDAAYLRSFGFSPATSMAIFIPNTYQLYWNTNAEQFIQRMKKEYDHFWTTDRKSKAIALGLSPVQVITLASIVEEETNYNPEKSRIAGVYLNRIRKHMLLQADPTVRFAIKDFSIKRVRDKHLLFISPYNTYLNEGLPPGPICTPSINSIDAVLNAEQNDYLYFCASREKLGTHVFAKTYEGHLLNARRYQKWRNETGR
jgi:UPF0755 protein